MPTTRAIAGSSTPARIIAPSRVQSSSSHSATAIDDGDEDDREPIDRERHAAAWRSRRASAAGVGDRDRIAGPDHQAEIGDHERQAERHQHLRELVAGKAAQQEALDDAPISAMTETARSSAASQKADARSDRS